jgi:hypothetical protein
MNAVAPRDEARMGGTDYLDASFTSDGGEEVLEVGEADAVERFVAEAVEHVVDIERVVRIDVHSVNLDRGS